MKVKALLPYAAAALPGVAGVVSEEASLSNGLDVQDVPPANSLQGAFHAMVDAAKARVAGLSSYLGDDPPDEPSSSTFATQLFAEVCSIFPSENVLISPLSIYQALVLVKDGATIGSDNEAELAQLLGPPMLIEETAHEEGDDPDVQLTMANSVWSSQLRQSYIDHVVSERDAEAFPLPETYGPISEWIEEQTNGMIEDFLGDGPIDRRVVALLVNCVYFKGAWTHEFDPEETVDGEFTLRDGTTVPARYMHAGREIKYIPWQGSSFLGGATAVVLDYGEKSDDDEPTEFTSLFILPQNDDEDSMNDAIESLKDLSMTDLLDQAQETRMLLNLPRFRLEFGMEDPARLKPALESLGMVTAFGGGKNKFDEMSEDPDLYVEDVLHGAVMEVTEEGTEAAATTVVPMRTRSRGPRTMNFNRPFVVAIVHRETGTPVFLGRVEEPLLDF